MTLRVSVIDFFQERWPQAIAKLQGMRGLGQFRPVGEQSSYSSLVIEYTVPEEKLWAFRKWHWGVIRAAQRFEGFVRADRHRPLNCKRGLLRWYSVIHFEHPDHLNQWLLSDEREALLQEGREIFTAYKFKSFETGLEGWFCHHSGAELSGLGPPAWKQILSVVLALYPVIMIQDLIFGHLGLFEDWSAGSAMVVNLLITTCILTLFVMPAVARMLDFWLQPAHRRAPLRQELVGTALTVLAMTLMVVVFNAVD
ncbi:hypothetical protein [Nodosilinea sp. P-1105]|uniref:hypothetical protein n=1 Tax=Nodosilinea sp. P-1105 TaxID=2546229 RepID=UPI00197E11C3|nr:hypothetical protein [Nodosilinea sp. P-1105]